MVVAAIIDCAQRKAMKLPSANDPRAILSIPKKLETRFVFDPPMLLPIKIMKTAWIRSIVPLSKNKKDSAAKAARKLPCTLKTVEFFLEAPSAKSVKLAGEFTEWEKFPIELAQDANGVWFTVVSLAPGNYPYRFLVDDQWCDDPRSTRQVANPFGTVDAIIEVA